MKQILHFLFFNNIIEKGEKMEILEEKRKIEQIPIYDEDGRVKYYKIPNYTKRKEFLTQNERKFMKGLVKAIKTLNEKNKERNVHIQISSQVAINRIIDINNRRVPELYEEIRDKSIDFVLYNIINGEILMCIELDDSTHENNEERKKRDILIEKMFEETINIVHFKAKSEYTESEILNKLKGVKLPLS